MKKSCRTKYNGFSLIEILLVLSLFAILIAMAVPFGLDFLSRDKVTTSRDILINSLRTAQQNAVNMQGDENWGVNIGSDVITVYKGTDYISRDATYDSPTPIPGGVSISGPTDLNFSKFEGIPDSSTTFVISGGNNASASVALDSEGLINY